MNRLYPIFFFLIVVQETQYIAGRLLGDGKRRHGCCLKLGNHVKQKERESLTNEERPSYAAQERR
jgi:hypothetical protein